MPTHPIPDLVRGLRTAARTLELVDTLAAGPGREEMLSDVQRDLSRLSDLLVSARGRAA